MGIMDGFLTQLSTGDTVKDYKHASQLFVSDNYNLSPKMGYLYHVYFDLDPTTDQGVIKNHVIEAGMLVKSIDLPKFSVDTKTMNSYNRPAVIQNKFKLAPVNISFHDDSADRVRSLWAKYFQYYYRDMDGRVDTSGKIAEMYLNQDGRYSAERKNAYGFSPLGGPGKAKNFIGAIRIYSLHQKRFSEYILVNPTITSFKHGQHVAGQSEPMACEMSVAYEFVLYTEGAVTGSSVAGFADLHYDKSPSSISPANGTRSILGPGGLMDTLDSAINSIPSNPLNAALQLYRGVTNANAMNLKQAAINELSNFGMEILRGNNPLNTIAVPALQGLSNKIKSLTTSIDSATGGLEAGAAVSNGATSITAGLAASAGTALPLILANVPNGNIISNIGKTLYGWATTPAQTSTPPATATAVPAVDVSSTQA